MKMKEKIPKGWLYFSVIALSIYLIIRLINQAQIMFIFPLDYTNDHSAYMAYLFFLKDCGFHNFCPYWYNGFVTFLLYPPGWMFFTYPLYLLFNNIQIATFISLILMYLLSFVFIWCIGKNNKFTKLERVAFFSFYFINAINVGNFIRLGRVTEMFAWTFFIAFAGLMIRYKDHKIDKKFLLVPLTFAIIIISHQTATVLASFLFLALFLVKKKLKEKLLLVGAGLLSLILSSFWLVPYLANVNKSATFTFGFARWLLAMKGRLMLTSLASVILPLILFLTFYFYWKTCNKSKKELWFFLPILILNGLFVIRVLVWVPVFKEIAPDSYMMFFMFFSLYFFFKTDFRIYKESLRKLICVGLILFAIVNILISVLMTPFFIHYTSYDYDTLELLPEVEGRLVILDHPTSYGKAYYSFIPIFYKIPVVGGWTNQVTTKEYVDKLQRLSRISSSDKKGCDNFKDKLDELNAVNIITYDEGCGHLGRCGFEKIEQSGQTCLYKN